MRRLVAYICRSCPSVRHQLFLNFQKLFEKFKNLEKFKNFEKLKKAYDKITKPIFENLQKRLITEPWLNLSATTEGGIL